MSNRLYSTLPQMSSLLRRNCKEIPDLPDPSNAVPPLLYLQRPSCCDQTEDSDWMANRESAGFLYRRTSVVSLYDARSPALVMRGKTQSSLCCSAQVLYLLISCRIGQSMGTPLLLLGAGSVHNVLLLTCLLHLMW